MTHPEMPIQPAGMHNLRWVGMFAQAGPVHVKPRTLWRSSALLRPHDELAGELAALGIRSVVDLRDVEERRIAPRTQRGALDWHSIPIFEGSLAGLHWETLVELYLHMVNQHGRQLAAAVQQVADSLPDPVLVHCTAGKDRTGLVCALAQDIVGVPRDQIEADYLASSQYLGADYLGDLAVLAGVAEIPGERAHRSTSTSVEALQRAWEVIDQRGGSRAYLIENGLDPAAFDKLESDLIER